MKDFPYLIRLHILGCYIDIYCSYKECLNEIKSYFSPSVSYKNDCTPDIIITCDWKNASKYLFRSRPVNKSKILKGIKYLSPLENEFKIWNSYLPPIPPFPIYPIKNRFVGLHASAIETNNEAILFVGEKGAGKSTTSVNIVQSNSNFSLITDETVLIHRRTNVITPFPRAVHIWEKNGNSLSKKAIPADEACPKIRKSSTSISQIFFLIPEINNLSKQKVSRLTPNEAITNLMQHHLDTGTDFHESFSTLIALAKSIPCKKFVYNSYTELTSLASYVM